MKVPIRYKSSDRYNAGVDVVYDDESKMQYAPFVYATTASGDSGDDGGEEGEDSMVVNIIAGENELSLDKTWQEIYDAIKDGKCVYLRQTIELETENGYILQPVSYVGVDSSDTPVTYTVASYVLSQSVDNEVIMTDYAFVASSPTETPSSTTV